MKQSHECTLIVYGSLAPEQPNHAQIAHIKGTWKKGTVLGRLEHDGWGASIGYPGFVTSDHPEPIEVHILFSDQLPRHWGQLDAFEGDEYTRRVIDFTTEDGQVGYGNIYALRK
ncbi:MAG: gamma-glutamylcyclotransferase family protein [Bacteroidota bacterium]